MRTEFCNTWYEEFECWGVKTQVSRVSERERGVNNDWVSTFPEVGVSNYSGVKMSETEPFSPSISL